MTDMINHPPHYTSCPSGVECIEIAELLPFCLGNCYKYLHRAELKGSYVEDLKKARFYAKRAFFNGEHLPLVAKNRINYVASCRKDRIGRLLAILKLWDADCDGRNSSTFLQVLDEEIEACIPRIDMLKPDGGITNSVLASSIRRQA